MFWFFEEQEEHLVAVEEDEEASDKHIVTFIFTSKHFSIFMKGRESVGEIGV